MARGGARSEGAGGRQGQGSVNAAKGRGHGPPCWGTSIAKYAVLHWTVNASRQVVSSFVSSHDAPGDVSPRAPT